MFELIKTQLDLQIWFQRDGFLWSEEAGEVGNWNKPVAENITAAHKISEKY